MIDLLSEYKKNNMLDIILLFILNCVFFYISIDSNYTFLLTIILFILFYYFSNLSIENKNNIFKLWLTFSVILFFSEYLVINSSIKPILKYKDPLFKFVPLWLGSAYLNMILLIILLIQYYKINLSSF